MTKQAFIFIGRSGCGKGTQAKLLIDYLKKVDPEKEILYIYSGDEFREFMKGDSETQRLCREILDVGGLPPEFLAVHMWTNVLIQKYTKDEHILIDGSPRRYHETGVMDSVFDFYSFKKPYVINIDISEEESMKRLLARGRFDDDKEEIKKKLAWYKADVLPAIEYYKDNPKYHFILLDGEQPIEKIHKDLIGKIALQ